MAFVTIGVSGSEHAHPAIGWGVDYAVAHRLDVELVHVVDARLGVIDADAAAALVAAEERMTEVVEGVASAHPGLAVRGTVLVGPPDLELISSSRDAAALVIGSHPGDAAAGAQVFSRHAIRIAERAETTVIVVPSDSARNAGRGLVAGVDGSELSMKALRFAASEADRHHEPLTAVHAWMLPWSWGLDYPPVWREEPPSDEQRVLAESMAGLAEDFPDIEVHRSLPMGPAASALHAESRGARMLAVGSHGRNAAGRVWFGSVSADLLLAMPCVVAIVR